MKILSLFLGVALFGTSLAFGAEKICGQNMAEGSASADQVCVSRGDSGAESVSLVSAGKADVLLRVESEDDVHSGGRVSELVLTDSRGEHGYAVVNWEERWIEGRAPGERDFRAVDLR